MFDVLDWLQSLPVPGLLTVMGAMGIGEGIIGVGPFFPGPPGMVIAAAALTSATELFLLWAVTIAGTTTGNVIGFELGRRIGPALRESTLVRKHAARHWDRAERLVQKHGRRGVFLGRMAAPIQSFFPPVAGAAGMTYRAFLPPLMIGAACSQAIPILAGVGVVASLNSGNLAMLAVVVLLVVTATVLVVRRRRRKNPALAPDRSQG